MSQEHLKEAREIFDSLEIEAKLELLEDVQQFCFEPTELDHATLDDIEAVAVEAIAGTLGEISRAGVLGGAEITDKAREVYSLRYIIEEE